MKRFLILLISGAIPIVYAMERGPKGKEPEEIVKPPYELSSSSSSNRKRSKKEEVQLRDQVVSSLIDLSLEKVVEVAEQLKSLEQDQRESFISWFEQMQESQQEKIKARIFERNKLALMKLVGRRKIAQSQHIKSKYVLHLNDNTVLTLTQNRREFIVYDLSRNNGLASEISRKLLQELPESFNKTLRGFNIWRVSDTIFAISLYNLKKGGPNLYVVNSNTWDVTAIEIPNLTQNVYVKNNILLTATKQGRLEIWDILSKKKLKEKEMPLQIAKGSIKFQPFNTSSFIVYNTRPFSKRLDCAVYMYDDILSEFKLLHIGKNLKVVYKLDPLHLLIITKAKEAIRYNIDTGEKFYVTLYHESGSLGEQDWMLCDNVILLEGYYSYKNKGYREYLIWYIDGNSAGKFDSDVIEDSYHYFLSNFRTKSKDEWTFDCIESIYEPYNNRIVTYSWELKTLNIEQLLFLLFIINSNDSQGASLTINELKETIKQAEILFPQFAQNLTHKHFMDAIKKWYDRMIRITIAKWSQEAEQASNYTDEDLQLWEQLEEAN